MGRSEFPSSRVHLWSSRQTGDLKMLDLDCSNLGGIVLSEHVLRRAAKLGDSSDCYFLGSASTSTDSITVTVDRLDQGKEAISDGKIIKVPTMVLPGDIIIPARIQREEDTLPFTGDTYQSTFSELEAQLMNEAPLSELLKLRCIVSLMPEDDLGTPLRVTWEIITPSLSFSLKPIPPLPLASTPVTRALCGDLAGVTKHGFVSLDKTRRGVLLLENDKSGLSDSVIVGCWSSLPLSHPINSDPNHPLGPGIWHQLIRYTFKQDLNRESPIPDPFLLCLLSGGTVYTWECTATTESSVFSHHRCSKYVVVPSEIGNCDTATFKLEAVPQGSDCAAIFRTALSSVKSNLWERKEEIEPRDAPCATPTTTEKTVAKRSLSPLSILVPSMSGSLLLDQPPPLPPPPPPRPTVPPAPVNGPPQLNGHDESQSETGQETPSQRGSIPPPQAEEGYPPVFSNPFGEEYPPNAFLSPPPIQPPYDPRYMAGYNGRAPESDYHHARQGSDPANFRAMSPYAYYPPHPFVDPMRYQYPPYPGYPVYPHHVPAFYPPNYSPVRKAKKPAKEKSSAFRSVGRTSPNKRPNHRSPSSFSSANKSLCSTSTVSSDRDESAPASVRSRGSKRGGSGSGSKKQHDTPRSLKSSASSSALSERRKQNCIRDVLDKSANSTRSSRTTSSQSDNTASISVKALKMLTLQKRQLDHLQEQVALLMKSTHTPPISASLDRSIECMREQMDVLERQIDKGGPNAPTTEIGVGTGNSLILHEHTGTNMTQCQAPQFESASVQCSEVAPSEESSVSFYLRFKENTDPQKSCNGWDFSASDNLAKQTSLNTFSKVTGGSGLKFREKAIFQHPKIQPPSHSIYNSVYVSSADLGQEEGESSHPGACSPVATTELSVASRKYLEKYHLREISPPTKHVDEGRKRLGPLRAE